MLSAFNRTPLRGALTALGTGLLIVSTPVLAEPFVPTSDAQVLEHVPAVATDSRARELLSLRQSLQADPRNLDRAVRLAQRYFDKVAAEGDPRYIGYAQAALQPWWDLPEPPLPVRVMRAILLQFDHRFEAALADLDAAVAEDPDNATAWSWRTAILMVRADYALARASCEQLAAVAPTLIGVGCRAQVDAVTGHADAAAASLRAALQSRAGGGDEIDADQRLWLLTRLAEIEERRADFSAAETAYRAALALGEPDVYLLAAYADFLLDRRRPQEVLALLKGKGRADVLLLRLALAAKAADSGERAALAAELGARFDAARQRGDTTHRKEESRYVLALEGDAKRALALGMQNFAVQREPADARILLEAALAARQPAAAEPALRWMADSGIQSVALQPLAAALKAMR